MGCRYTRIRRYNEILAVFVKHGFGLLLERLGLLYDLRGEDKISEADIAPGEASAGRRLRLALEELGPTFVKLGQLLSMRQDILPPGVIEELKKLQDCVQPFPFTEVKALIEAEFGDNLGNIYREFDEEPVAAASISQVHRARLASGEQVAVKVQRPGVEKVIDLDLDILKKIARFVDRHTRLKDLYDFSGMIREFEKTIKDELDFTKEGENADAFRHNFSRYQGIRVPKVKWIYTTKRVLTMEYIEGIKVSDVKALEEAGIDGKRVAERLATCICNQIFRDGFFHADPHPGNIKVMPDGTIVFLDLGMVGRLNEFQKAIISKFLIGVVFRDSHLVVKSLVDMKAVTSQSRVRDFKKDIDDLIGKYLTMPMNEIKIEEVFREVFRIAFLNRVKIPREFTLLAKTLGTLQGLLEKLAPDLNALVIAEPIAKKLFYQSFFDRKMYGKMGKSLLNYRELLSEFPAALRNILDKMADEEFAVQFEMKDMDRLQRQLERLFNRVSFSIILLAVSIIIAGVIISSGLSAGTSGEMHIFNITVLKAGLALAAVIVVGLLISMIRSRH